MPSRLFSTGRPPLPFRGRKDARFQAQIQERQLASQVATHHTVDVKPPWEGLTTDLPHEGQGFQLVKSTVGLVAKADPTGSGEVLMNDAGFEEVDGDRLPLTDHANNSKVVVHINQFPLLDATAGTAGTPLGEDDTKAIVLVAGDGSNAGSFEMWQLLPSNGQWAEIDYDTATAASPAPHANRDGDDTDTESKKSMPDSCVFHGGAPNRSDITGAIDQPVIVWTNNEDPVMVYPNTTNGTKFEPITNTVGADGPGEGADNEDFRCMSVETFGDRVYFLNTWEVAGANGRRYQNRLRRSARGTCDPDTATIGSGFIDLDTFAGAGLRAETLGNVLACYFEDGVAFIRETGLASAPNAVQVLDTDRGLLGTHAVTSISDNLHFGIFDDGWWFLDSSGRWKEAGVTEFNGKPIDKWRRAFYSLIDPLNTHRVHTFYDRERNWVRIVVPQPSGDTTSTRETTVTWIYDIEGDRVWTLDYPETLDNGGGVTVWGELIQRDDNPVTWATVAGTWASISGSWDSFAPEKGQKRLCHGNHTGYVYAHNEQLINYDGQAPAWSYEVLGTDLGRSRSIKTVDRVGVEHVNSSNDNPVTVTVLNGKGTTESGSTSLNKGNAADVEIANQSFRHTGEHISFSVSGEGPVRIRSFDVDLFEDGVERRD